MIPSDSKRVYPGPPSDPARQTPLTPSGSSASTAAGEGSGTGQTAARQLPPGTPDGRPRAPGQAATVATAWGAPAPERGLTERTGQVGTPPPRSEKEELRQLVTGADPQRLERLQQFATKEYSIENLLFLTELAGVARDRSPFMGDEFTRLWALYDGFVAEKPDSSGKFIGDDQRFQVNLPGPLREKITQSITLALEAKQAGQNLRPHIMKLRSDFDEAFEEILKLTVSDTFKRFIAQEAAAVDGRGRSL